MKRHYHFIGIGGIGMGTLASLLLAKGYKVSGSDIKGNELTQQLKKKGCLITIGHHASNVKNPDFVVYSSAIRVNNPELIEAVSCKVPVLKRAEVLAQMVNQEIGITVAGAHGKTTTTSMISGLLMDAGLKPTSAVGGVINDVSSGAHLGEGKYFVAEVDESDGTFLYFRPHFSVITNIDYEHVDYYKSWEGILEAWAKFLRCTHKDGKVIACGEDAKLKELLRKADVSPTTFGLSNDQDFYAQNIITNGFSSRFDCFSKKEGKLGVIELAVPGRHNCLNALACVALGVGLKIRFDVIAASLKKFCGVKRRFQLKGNVDDVMVIDDYGHHPTEVAATINAAKSFHRKRVITVFQPHRYSRTKFLLDEFVESLSGSDQLILTDIYAASEKPTDGVPVKELVAKLERRMAGGFTYLKKEDILSYVQKIVRPGDMVLFLGAGDIYHLSDDLVGMLNAQALGAVIK